MALIAMIVIQVFILDHVMGSNGVDDDCDGTIDDGSGAIFHDVDGDGDGYGAGTGSFFCRIGCRLFN